MYFAAVLLLLAASAQQPTAPRPLPDRHPAKTAVENEIGRFYLRSLPIPGRGLGAVGFAYSDGKGVVSPLVGVEIGAIWADLFDDPVVTSGLQAYVGARFLARPDSAASFVTELGGGVLGFPLVNLVWPVGRVALGYRRSGTGVHWDLLASFVVVQMEDPMPSTGVVPVPVPTLEFGISL